MKDFDLSQRRKGSRTINKSKLKQFGLTKRKGSESTETPIDQRVDETDGDGKTALHYQLINKNPSAAEATTDRFTSCFSLPNGIGNNVLHSMATMGYLT